METTLTSWLVETGSGEQHGGAQGVLRRVPEAPRNDAPRASWSTRFITTAAK